MNFRPKDQIILLAGLAEDHIRQQIWTLPELEASMARLTEAGLIDDGRMAPAGIQAAQGLRHITLGDLVAEHLPERA